MRYALALALLAGAASPVLAQSIATGTAPGIPWLRVSLSLGFCLALAWGVVMLLRLYQRRGVGKTAKGFLAWKGTTAPRRIAILETRRASIHADLCLIECDGQTYLLALTPAGATVLDRQEPAENVI